MSVRHLVTLKPLVAMRYPNRLPLPRFFAAALALLLSAAPSYSQDVQLSASAEAAAIAGLESGDASRILEALRVLPDPHYDPLYKEKISYRLALALIDLSEEQTTLYFNDPNYQEDMGVDHEFASGLSDYVVALKMPEAIPALLKATQFGNPAAYALADFGPDIVYDIIEYIDNPGRTYYEIDGAFFAIKRTVETHRPLNPAIRSDVKDIVVRYLERAEKYYSGPDGSASTIMNAMSVARVLGDPDLKQMIIDILPFEKERNLRFNGMGTNWAQYTLDNWDVVQEDQIYLND